MSGKPVECSLDKVAFQMGHVIFRRCENKMKRLLTLIVLVFAECGESEEITTGMVPAENFYKPIPPPPSINKITEEVNVTATITDEQVEILNRVSACLSLNLTSITDIQAESLSKVEFLELEGVTSISDKQAEHLSKVKTLRIPETLQPLIDKYKKQ